MNDDRAQRFALVPVLAALLLSACSEHSAVPTEPVNEGDVAVVVISDFAFSAPTLTIDAGTSVRRARPMRSGSMRRGGSDTTASRTVPSG